jgi:hypothetical protein
MRSKRTLALWQIFALAVIGAVTVFLIFRVSLPSVMQDELVYSLTSRKLPPSENVYGNFLYSYLYSSTNVCGAGFYACAKGLNAFFLVTLFIALAVMFRSLGTLAGLLLFASVFLSPFVLYSALFMPEIPFLAASMLALALFFRSTTINRDSTSWLFYVAGVATLAVAALLKIHALFLVFPVALFLVLAAPNDKKRKAWIRALLAIPAVLALKLGLGVWIAGQAGLTIFGSSYDAQLLRLLSSFVPEAASSQALALVELPMVGGAPAAVIEVASRFEAVSILQVASWTLIFLALINVALALSSGRLVFSKGYRNTSTFTTLLLLSVVTLFAVSVVFAVAVAAGGESLEGRVLTRYFEFLLPFIFVFAYVEVSRHESSGAPRRGVIISAGVLSASVLVLWLTPTQNLADSSVLFAIGNNRWVLFVLILGFIVGHTKGQSNLKAARLIGVSFVLITTVAAASTFVTRNSDSAPSDLAGQYVATELAGIPGSSIFVLGSNEKRIQASMFQMNKQGVRFGVFNQGETVSLLDIPDGITMVIQFDAVLYQGASSKDLIGGVFLVSTID